MVLTRALPEWGRSPPGPGRWRRTRRPPRCPRTSRDPHSEVSDAATVHTPPSHGGVSRLHRTSRIVPAQGAEGPGRGANRPGHGTGWPIARRGAREHAGHGRFARRDWRHAVNAPAAAHMAQALAAEHRRRLMRFARKAPFPQGTRLFEGGRPRRLVLGHPYRKRRPRHARPRPPCGPHRDAPTGRTHRLVLAVRPACLASGCRGNEPGPRRRIRRRRDPLDMPDDPALGTSVTQWVDDVLARRLQAAHTRLPKLYAPYGSGSLL